MTITFVPASSHDVPELLSMMKELYEYDHTPFNTIAHKRALEGLMQEPLYGRVWLIIADAQVAGYVVMTFGYSLEFRGRDAFLDELFVRESFRGNGLGSEALAFIEKAALAFGIKALHLEVAHTNTRAQEIYRRTGYADHDRYLMTKWVRDKS